MTDENVSKNSVAKTNETLLPIDANDTLHIQY